ncbi:MAG: type II toxin-antitoxin system death-on-curing family toxin [Candidatus Babeliales bacterium]
MSKDEILDIHTKQIKRYGGSLGVRDQGLLDSCVFEPQQTFGGAYLYPTIFDMTAAYVCCLIKNHPFVDGNKRTGMVTAIAFLGLNGVRVYFTQQQFFALAIVIATSIVDIQKTAQIFSQAVVR